MATCMLKKKKKEGRGREKEKTVVVGGKGDEAKRRAAESLSCPALGGVLPGVRGRGKPP